MNSLRLRLLAALLGVGVVAFAAALATALWVSRDRVEAQMASQAQSIALSLTVALTAPQEWWSAVEARVSADPTHPLFPLLGLLAGTPELTGVQTPAAPRLDDVRAQEALRGSGIAPAVLDAAFLRRVVAGLDAPGPGDDS